MHIALEDPRTPDIQALLEGHLAFARSASPPEDVHALDLAGLLEPSIAFHSARRAGVLLGVGAIKQLEVRHAEIKSMHTTAAARRQGVGRAILAHLIGVARERGCERVSLETGTMEAFAAARALYLRAGFVPCEPFGRYTVREASICMTLLLDS